MNDRMPVGIDDFQKVREGYYFVDKTDFIKDLIDSHGEVTLLIRPRRFGKTLTMSMLDWFFSAEKEKESRELFQGLHIASDEKNQSSILIVKVFPKRRGRINKVTSP